MTTYQIWLILCHAILYLSSQATTDDMQFFLDTNPTIATALEHRGQATFIHYVRQANLEHLLDSTGPYTVFVPTDKALKDVSNDLATKLAKDATAVWSFVTYHVISGAMQIEEFKDGESITSLTGQLSYLNTIVKNGVRMAWIQGCRILQSNIKISNGGFLHIIEKPMLLPETDLLSFLEKSDDHKNIHKIFKSSGMKITSSMTFLAPLDSSFSQLTSKVKRRLFEDKIAQQQLIRYHTVPKPMCMDRMLQQAERFNLTSSLGLELRSYKYPFLNNSLFIENAVYLGSSAVYEGFVGQISQVLIPEARIDVVEMAKSNSAAIFATLVHRAGLNSYISSLHRTFTIFAPSDKAFRSLNKAIWNQINNNPDYLMQIVKMHIVRYWHNLEQQNHFVTLPTLWRNLNTRNAHQIRINRFYEKTVVEGAVVKSQNLLAANGLVNIIDRVILPHEKSLYEICLKDPRISIYTRILKRSGFKNIFLKSSFQLTLFVPTDEAFANWFKRKKQTFRHTVNEYRQIIQRHATFHAFFSNVITDGRTYELSTLHPGRKLRLRKLHMSQEFTFLNQSATSVTSNKIALNGVLYLINNVLQ